jgi:hypothetical protein
MDGQVRARMALDPGDLSGLSRRRSLHVRDLVLADSTVAPERVFITGAKDVARTDSLGVKLELTLTD